ncbi:hypothetical protein PCI56_06140 [Plesiomonas shigelloides subsp. oncorhynchi]|nr:hypothetical protein [Plesiomonas shigelloides]
MIRALGGHYFRVHNGEPTGFNPFQMEPTTNNITFLKMLVRWLVRPANRELEPFEELSISKAVDTVMRMDKSIRRLSMVNQNISVELVAKSSVIVSSYV